MIHTEDGVATIKIRPMNEKEKKALVELEDEIVRAKEANRLLELAIIEDQTQ